MLQGRYDCGNGVNVAYRVRLRHNALEGWNVGYRGRNLQANLHVPAEDSTEPILLADSASFSGYLVPLVAI